MQVDENDDNTFLSHFISSVFTTLIPEQVHFPRKSPSE